MRGFASVFLVMIVLFLFSFMALGVNSDYADFKKSPGSLEFKTFTSAVCEEKNDLRYCKDELFIDCNGKISKAKDVTECNGFKLNNQKVTGFAVFEKDWKDPRAQ